MAQRCARPQALPVDAKALGIPVSQSLLVRADDAIQ
jgi:hypothetical protein